MPSHIGREYEFQALGKTWKAGRWDRSVWLELVAWAKEFLPNPLDEVAKRLDSLALKDAKILRQLEIDDQKEVETAKREKRQPVLMAPKYKPFADDLTDKALDRVSSYLSFESPEMMSVLKSIPGTTQLMYLLLKRHQPDITEDDAYDIVVELPEKTLQEIFVVTQGKSSSKKNGTAK